MVAVEARKAADLQATRQPSGSQPASADASAKASGTGSSSRPGRPSVVSVVTSLTYKRLAELPPDPRPLPSVSAYDQLPHDLPDRPPPSARQESS